MPIDKFSYMLNVRSKFFCQFLIRNSVTCVEMSLLLLQNSNCREELFRPIERAPLTLSGENIPAGEEPQVSHLHAHLKMNIHKQSLSIRQLNFVITAKLNPLLATV